MTTKRDQYKQAYSINRLMNRTARRMMSATTFDRNGAIVGFTKMANDWNAIPYDVRNAVQSTNEHRFDRVKLWRNQTWQDWFEDRRYRRYLAQNEY